MFGRRERVRRGGYATRRGAEQARDELLERSRAERTTQTWTVARWLRHWLTTRTSIRPSTLRSYTEHVEHHLIPHVGRIRLGELTGRDVAAMFAALIEMRTRYGRPMTPATLHHIRRSGPSTGLTRGGAANPVPPWPCGRLGSWPASSTFCVRTGCSRSGG
jgi:hypothetical protein